jgi:predicted enzyme related to lactoylglutathione lyase
VSEAGCRREASVQATPTKDYKRRNRSLTDAVGHFEIYAEEPAALADFYRQLFDWQVECVAGTDYWRIDAGATPTPGLAGGLTYRPVAGTRGWVHYVHVASLDDAVAEAMRFGAIVLRPKTASLKTASLKTASLKTASRKTAWYAVLADPEGNIFAIYQREPAACPPPGSD